MAEFRLTMMLLPERYAVCRLNAGSDIPQWVTSGDFFSITRTLDELSVVCPDKTSRMASRLKRIGAS